MEGLIDYTLTGLFEHLNHYLRCWLGGDGRFTSHFNKLEAECDVLLTAGGGVARGTKDVEIETPI